MIFMKKFLFVFILIFSSVLVFFPFKKQLEKSKQEIRTEKISFEGDFSSLFTKAKIEKKLVLLYFTTKNPSECVWCKKMEKKIFNDSEFQKHILGKFLVYRIDLTEKNSEASVDLKQKFDVEWLPTLVLLSEKEELIGKMGYLPISGKEYAENLLKKVEDWRLLVDASYDTLSAHELKRFYHIADEQGFDDLKQKIFAVGVAKKNLYFLLEKYQELLFEQKVVEAKNLREEIENLDPKNLYRMHLKLAFMDFYIFSEQKKNTPEVVAPLLNYLEKFGVKDRDNRWQLEALISHFYSLREEKQKALDHARLAYKYAPLLMKKELNGRVVELKTIIDHDSDKTL